jgi:CheY-like chemotaxis protein
MKQLRVLLIEDNPLVIADMRKAINKHFSNVEFVSVTSPDEVLARVNNQPAGSWDIILLDYVYSAGIDNFHVFDIAKFGPEHVISISSTGFGNQAARARGVTHIVPKSYRNIESFLSQVVREIKLMVDNDSPHNN